MLDEARSDQDDKASDFSELLGSDSNRAALELRGTIEMAPRDESGSVAKVVVPVTEAD